MQPKVSIVMPVYNARNYLKDRFASLLSQTLSDIEIVCIDDGSTDGSRGILDDYAERDSRIHVVSQSNSGPAVARNHGLELVQGEYVTFFDCDDDCDRNLLELAYKDAVSSDADIVIFAEKGIDCETGVVFDLPWSMQSGFFPNGVFSYRDNPDRILTSFQNWLHNKLFKVEFIRSHGLTLQKLSHTEDMLFTCRALLEAERLVCVHGATAYYRMGNINSQRNSAGAKHPLDFLSACITLHDYLVSSGLMDEVRVSYQNWVAECVLVNSSIVSNLAADRLVFNALRNRGLEELELLKYPDYYFDDTVPEKLNIFLDSDYTEFIFNQLVEIRAEREKLARAYEGLRSSKTYRLGDAIAAVPRAILSFLSRKR